MSSLKQQIPHKTKNYKFKKLTTNGVYKIIFIIISKLQYHWNNKLKTKINCAFSINTKSKQISSSLHKYTLFINTKINLKIENLKICKFHWHHRTNSIISTHFCVLRRELIYRFSSKNPFNSFLSSLEEFKNGFSEKK